MSFLSRIAAWWRGGDQFRDVTKMVPEPLPMPVVAVGEPVPFFSNAAYQADRQPSEHSRFAACIAEVLRHEGGYVNHPSDPGGETNFGITKRSYPLLDIRNLSRERAEVIYRQDYWPQVGGKYLPAGVDLAVFDYGVNSGPGRAIRSLQAALGVKVDGVLGVKTLEAVSRIASPSAIVRAICTERRAFLRGLKTWPVFGVGWARRVDSVETVALRMARGE